MTDLKVLQAELKRHFPLATIRLSDGVWFPAIERRSSVLSKTQDLLSDHKSLELHLHKVIDDCVVSWSWSSWSTCFVFGFIQVETSLGTTNCVQIMSWRDHAGENIGTYAIDQRRWLGEGPRQKDQEIFSIVEEAFALNSLKFITENRS